MPTYEYACNHCGHEFEAFQSITAKPLRNCPECKKPSLRRLIGTGAGIIFKGSGFYQTDYRSDSYKKAAEKDSGDTATKGPDKKKAKTETKSSSTETGAPKTEKKSA